MIKRILVTLGGRNYTASECRHAIELAQAHDAEVTGIGILDEGRLAYTGPVPLGEGQYAQDLAKSRLTRAKECIAQALQEFTDACFAGGVRHRVLREVGEPLSLMIDQARYHDLMVFGLRSLFEFEVIQEPRDALVRLVQAGVRPLLAVSQEFQPVRKVLIAYSGSMESATAMKRFVEMRLWPDVQLRIVTFEEGQLSADLLLGDAANYCHSHGFQPETECLPGEPKDQLLPYAESWGADLLVMSNSVKNLLLRRLFGETSLHVIRHATRPLFLTQ